MSEKEDLGDGHHADYYSDYLDEHGLRDGMSENEYELDDPMPFPRTRFPPSQINAMHASSDVDSAQIAQHHTLGPRHNQSAPGDHIHDGITSKGFSWQPFTIASSTFWQSVGSPQPSIGSGTIAARYVKLGTLVIYHFEITFASDTTLGTAEWLFKLPFAAKPAAGNSSLALTGVVKGYNGTSNINHVGGMWLSGADQISIVSEGGNDSWGPGVPTTWNANNGNYFTGTVIYESTS